MAHIKVFYTNISLFKNKLLSKYSKYKHYHSIIRPIVIPNACETWMLKEAKKQKVMILKKRIRW